MRLGIDSSLTRWMCFVDGENLTIRGQAFAATNGLELVEGANFHRDTFLWFPRLSMIDVILTGRESGSYSTPIRQYYYTSQTGDEKAITDTREALRLLEFEPKVFKKPSKAAKAKGVDLALATDFLGHAFRGNYDVAFLFAGDGDYAPLLEEIKRIGKVACVCFFSSEGLNSELRLAADHFLPIDMAFVEAWKQRAPT